MARQPLPSAAVVVSFIHCINRGDLDGLTALMTDDHRLEVLAEAPLVGREAWHGYFSSFPDYVIYPRYVTASAGTVAVLGTTTGSHLGLADEDETKLDVIWIADVADGRLSVWRVADDTPEIRDELGIPPTA